MKKIKFFILCLLIVVTLPFAYGGCGGGGGGGSSDSAESSKKLLPSVQVLPSEHDFGTATLGNMPAS